jgi:hypothetical protein
VEPAVRLVRALRRVRHVDVRVAVGVVVDELDVAPVVEHRRELLHGPIREVPDREAPEGVDPDPVLLVPHVAAVGEHGVPVAVQVDVGEVDVLGRLGAGRYVGRVAHELLRQRSRSADHETQAGQGDSHGDSRPGSYPGPAGA